MNKTKTVISATFFLVFILSISALSSCNKGSANNSSENTKPNKLSLKADSALVFCKDNQMNTEFCFLIDMSIHSGKHRFFVWDFDEEKVIVEGLCAHGSGGKSTKQTPEFSNVVGSNCTSLGKYKTGARSYSNWGINIHYKLHGLEETNDNAFERIVVLHSYEYVPKKQIHPLHLPLGYSLGCPVICNDLMQKLDDKLKDKTEATLLWIFD